MREIVHALGTEFTGEKFKDFKTSEGRIRDCDSGPLTCKVENGHQPVIQGQGHFTKQGV